MNSASTQPRPRWRDHFDFFRVFLTRPGRIGALCPSSAVLAQAMVVNCPLSSASVVVELGPGTGAVTGLILKRISRGTLFLPIELDPACVAVLKERFPGVKVFADSAERLPELVRQAGKSQVDCVISGLPWANMPQKLQQRILGAIVECLPPGGVFNTFAYVHACWLPTARRFRASLANYFSEVQLSPVVWRNVPPAIVYRCTR